MSDHLVETHAAHSQMPSIIIIREMSSHGTVATKISKPTPNMRSSQSRHPTSSHFYLCASPKTNTGIYPRKSVRLTGSS